MRRQFTTAAAGRRNARLVAAAAALLLAGCSSSDDEVPAGAPEGVPAGALAASHVHGVAVDPADGTLLLATHDGLYEIADDGRSSRVGPVIDLMGFAVAGPGHFLASGHPGQGVDLPQPVGLIESTDGGRTWEPVSRQGQSDFHALAVSPAGVLGYDGSLRYSDAGEEWETRSIPAAPHTLAASPDGAQILATTEQGLLRSPDGGRTWEPVVDAPLLQVVAWAGDGSTVAGLTPAGVVWTSGDGADTWTEAGDLGEAPQAVAVDSTGGGPVRILAVTEAGLYESMDGGSSFEPRWPSD